MDIGPEILRREMADASSRVSHCVCPQRKRQRVGHVQNLVIEIIIAIAKMIIEFEMEADDMDDIDKQFWQAI
jgi:hypothetical protein